MNSIEAALAHCSRDANGLLKLSWLWADPRKAHTHLSRLVRSSKLTERVVTLRTKGSFASEEVARQLAELISAEQLWRAAEAVPEQAVDVSDVGRQLSTLLGHPVNFRLRTTPQNWPALIDVTMIFTGLNNNQAAEAVRHLLAQYPEVKESIVNFKFPGRGQRAISVAPLAAALNFAFLLPGKAAAQMRRQAATLVVRYLGGDVTLVDEVYANRRAQESLAPVPAEHRTPLDQAARMCGEAVEAQAQEELATPDLLFVPRKPLVIQDKESVGLPGSDHLYAASRHGENLIKIGVSKDVLQRLRDLAQSFGGQYELLAVWPNEAVLEGLVLEILKSAKASVRSSREHFNANASFAQICQVVVAARHLHKTRTDLDAGGCKRSREDAEFEEDLADRALKRRQREMQMQQDDARTSLLLELVRTGDEEAKRVFLAGLTVFRPD